MEQQYRNITYLHFLTLFRDSQTGPKEISISSLKHVRSMGEMTMKTFAKMLRGRHQKRLASTPFSLIFLDKGFAV